jgi:hypothetical protein
MKNIVLVILGLSFLFTSCQNTKALEEQILKLEQKNRELQMQLIEKGPDKGELVHTVFLQTKVGTDLVDRQMYLDEVLKMNRLDYVHDVHVGIKADTKDPRSITNNDAYFSMIFESVQDYYKWQEDSVHMALKKLMEPYLASEPITYDYWVP